MRAIAAVALVATALVGVTFAQFANNQTTVATIVCNSQVVQPWVNSIGLPYYINSTAGAPYCYNNGTIIAYCQSCQGCYDHHTQIQNPYQYDAIPISRNNYGVGRCWWTKQRITSIFFIQSAWAYSGKECPWWFSAVLASKRLSATATLYPIILPLRCVWGCRWLRHRRPWAQQ